MASWESIPVFQFDTQQPTTPLIKSTTGSGIGDGNAGENTQQQTTFRLPEMDWTSRSSKNELAVARRVVEDNSIVSHWIDRHLQHNFYDQAELPSTPTGDLFVGIRDEEIPAGCETENRLVIGQTYFIDDHPALEKADFSLMREGRHWQDGPTMAVIDSSSRNCPETSQYAIQKYEKMCKEVDETSELSQAATWGTQPLGWPTTDSGPEQDKTRGVFLRRVSHAPTVAVPHSPRAEARLVMKGHIDEPFKHSDQSSQDTSPWYPTPISSHGRYSQSQPPSQSLPSQTRTQLPINQLEDGIRIKEEETHDEFSVYGDSQSSQDDDDTVHLNPEVVGRSPVISEEDFHGPHVDDTEEDTPITKGPPPKAYLLPPEPFMESDAFKHSMLPPNRPGAIDRQDSVDLFANMPQDIAPTSKVRKNPNAEPSGNINGATLRVLTHIVPVQARVGQTGVARFRLELLSILKAINRVDSPGSSDSRDSNSENEQDQREDFEENGAQVDSKDESSGHAGIDGTQQIHRWALPGYPQGDADGRSRKRKADDDGEGDGNDAKRPCQNSLVALKGRSFACPYHVYEPNPGQNPCFSRSLGENKVYKGMARLKRCPRCWICFDSREKENQHRRILRCTEKARPRQGQFMAVDLEGMVNTWNVNAANPEQSWWEIFQLIVPGMQQQDLSELKRRYPHAPYRAVPADNVLHTHTPTLIMPPVQIDHLNPLFPTLNDFFPSRSGDFDQQISNLTELSSQAPPAVTFPLPSQSTNQSQVFSVPIFGLEAPHSGEQLYPQPATVTPSDMSLLEQMLHPGPSHQQAASNPNTSMKTVDSLSQSTNSNALAESSRATSFLTGANASDSDQQSSHSLQQLQRRNQRLGERLQRAERAYELAQLGSQAARANLGQADTLLEDLMDCRSMPDDIYTGLEKLSKMIQTAVASLKKGV
ncbi:hypothetical protein QBC40DRAFT_325528 [Triangularia verruculosa]|uniref:Uncharacterized protein n=1 Tax=Triangularia verruculosa TaxID=2587418 RepID=A0AAN6XHV8_9PEZI|nr:hypothetical protein QBC40DRAFT_325528 [Triangularia verruculosa]